MTTILAILNITPDSFAGDGYLDTQTACARAAAALQQGAAVLDIGAESTRPGSIALSEGEEKARLLPVLQGLRQAFPQAVLSVDTTKAAIARVALENGVSIINDISGGQAEAEMLPLLASARSSTIILMHNAAHRALLDDTGHGLAYAAGGEEVDTHTFLHTLRQEMQQLAEQALAVGVRREQIILDPGLGFGKTVAQNMAIIANVRWLKEALSYPLLLGASRKSFIGVITQTAVAERGAGTIAVHTLAALGGVDYLRVHDVADTKAAIEIVRRAGVVSRP
jgi:dihydropteroate synthase